MSAKMDLIFFSPTGSTGEVFDELQRVLAEDAKGTWEVAAANVTMAANRGVTRSYGAEDALVVGFPVYAGRVPVPFLQELQGLRGQDTPVAIVASFGNRHFDDALLEAADTLAANGFVVVAAAAFSCEHSFTAKVGTGRPDDADLAIAADFARQLLAKLAEPAPAAVEVPGNSPYTQAPPMSIFTPLTSDDCIGCLACVEVCPTAAISSDDPAVVSASCIGCGACINACAVDAKIYPAEVITPIIGMLEANCTARREPVLVL
ncbi:MAG: 4Fe-4S binding protein [Coriobacteriales bacterium]|jgi:ferredoxin|nr:4Fe-4S binding protein [Coriobacteriales bacterium]